jgi:DNA-binding transcriptional MerR regulator
MQFVTRAIEKFMITEFENYSSLMITSLAMAKLDDNFNPEDLKRLMFIETWTHEDLGKSIYELDRMVDPSKVTGDPTNYQYNITFKSDYLFDKDDNESKRKISVKSDKLQKYLCEAIREVNEIIYKNFKKYNDEYGFQEEGEESTDKFKFG